jgi:ABC-2 type transport system ATP-binding protein
VRPLVFAIAAKSLTRTFGGKKGKEPLVALDNVDLQVEEGELFGLLGPNGAGKTTLIKILSTLLLPSSGTVKVLGHDVLNDSQSIRRRINMVSGGETSGYGILTVKENLWMFTQFYGVPSEVAKRRIDEMLTTFGLADKKNSTLRTVSTGQRQKMNVVRGFVTDPDLIFLDEPTLGLDVTHYMLEADELCNRVAIIDRGRILACDTPANLKRSVSRNSTFSITTTPFAQVDGVGQLPGVKGFEVKAQPDRLEVNFVLEDESVIADIISFMTARQGKVLSLTKSQPTLEDVFIGLVGRGLG